MAHLSRVTCRQFAKARRDLGMTQSGLAQAVGCKQSAISMLESGQPEKLSQENIEKIAKLLGLTLDDTSAKVPLAHSQGAQVHLDEKGFCPNMACFSNVPYLSQGELLFWPQLQPLSQGRYCRFCGELLESHCPECGAGVTNGACCPTCGKPKITNTLPPEHAAGQWIEERCKEIARWKTLTS